MYKVLVAEDEPLINEGIKKMIETLRTDFRVEASAFDGEGAIQCLKEQHFDVVFSDIRMPKMDGIELLKYISENYPQTVTVVLSGYEIFDYAQKALKYQVLEYLLKPITISEMEKLLERVVSQLKKIQETRHERYYHAVFSGVEKKEIEEKQDKYRMFLVNLGSYKREEMEDREKEIQDKKEMDKFFEDKDLERCFWFPGRYPSEYIFIEEYGSNIPNAGKVKELYDNMRQKGKCITLLESPNMVSLNHLYEEYKILHKRMRVNLIYGKSTYIVEDGMGDTYTGECKEQESDICSTCVKTGDEDTVKKYIEKMLNVMCEKSITQDELERKMKGIFHTIIRTEAFSDITIEQEVQLAICTSENYDELLDALSEIVHLIMRKEEKSGNKLVDVVRKYLEENYKEKITTKDLSRQFGLVPSYLSMIFRQAQGISPSDYLNNIRIKKAKQFLEETELSVKEIAERIGFADQLYFSKVFKKETGETPSAFRIHVSS